MKRLLAVLLGATTCALSGGALLDAASAAPVTASTTGRVSIVQAVPGQTIGVAVGDRTVSGAAPVGSVIGPLDLPAGRQKITFTSGSNTITTAVQVRAGGNSDVVLHLPAQARGAPLVNTYQVPLQPIGAGKARVLLAHTATVGAVNASVDAKQLFDSVSNGQFVQTELPSGKHQIALRDAADKSVLGAFGVPLASKTLSMVYAYVDDGEMKTIVDTRRLASDGAVAPTRIHTGSAGLASGAVADFGLSPTSRSNPTAVGLGTFAGVLGLGVLVLRLRRLAPRRTAARRPA